MMKNLLVTVIFLCLSMMTTAQSYEVESFQSKYQSLENYQSVLLLNDGDEPSGFRVDLGFEFPYFEQNFDHILLSMYASFSFDNNNSMIQLLSNLYTLSMQNDPNSIESDVRYSIETINGIKVFICQFTHVHLYSDNSMDSYLNFQCRFYENGVIEWVMGDANLENSPNYVAGEGFYTQFTNTEPMLFGPYFSFQDPNHLKNLICLSGAYDDLEVIHGQQDIFHTIPPSGWTIKLIPSTVVAVDELSKDEIKVFPNPVNNKFQIESAFEIKDVELLDITGRLVRKIKFVEDEIDVSRLKPGIYILNCWTNKGRLSKKIVKE